MTLTVFRKKTDFLVGILFLIASLWPIMAIFYDLPLQPYVYIAASAAAVSILTLTLTLLNNASTEHTSQIYILLSVLIFSLLLSLILQQMFQEDLVDTYGRSAKAQTREIFIVGMIWLLCGAAIQRIKINYSTLLSILLLVFLSYNVIKGIDDGFMISYGTLSESRDDGIVLNHLLMGESATMLLALAFASATRYLRLLVFILGTAILFALGGRGALFSFVVAILCFLLVRQPLSYTVGFVILSVGIAIILITSVITLGPNDPYISRMLFLEGIGADSSAAAREYFLQQSLNALPTQALIGDPGFLIHRFGSLGAYIHNLLSAWQFFGVFPFLLFCYFIIVIAKFIFKHRRDTPLMIDEFGLIVFFQCVISVIIAKSINFHAFWFVLGFWLFKIANSSKRSNPPSICH